MCTVILQIPESNICTSDPRGAERPIPLNLAVSPTTRGGEGNGASLGVPTGGGAASAPAARWRWLQGTTGAEAEHSDKRPVDGHQDGFRVTRGGAGFPGITFRPIRNALAATSGSVTTTFAT